MTQNRAVRASPCSVRRVQRPVAGSNTADTTRVFNRDIAAQVKTVGNVIDVAQDFRLRAVAFRPAPVLLKVVGEGVGILHTFDVAAGAGVAVPEPGAADAGPGLEHP